MKITTSRFGLGLYAFLGLAGMGAGNAFASPAGTAVSPAIVVGALKLTSKGGSAELKPDGSIVVGKTLVATITGADVKDALGKPLLHVDRDGLVTGPDVTRKITLSAAGTLVGPDGSFSIQDNGTVVKTDAAGKVTPSDLRFEGVTPATRRAALLVFLLNMMPSRAEPAR